MEKAFTRLSGIDRSQTGKIARGERNVTLLNIERVATALQAAPPPTLQAEAGYSAVATHGSLPHMAWGPAAGCSLRFPVGNRHR